MCKQRENIFLTKAVLSWCAFVLACRSSPSLMSEIGCCLLISLAEAITLVLACVALVCF